MLHKLNSGSHDQADAEWIVIRTQLRGHNYTPFGQPASGRPSSRPESGRPSGIFCMFWLLLISSVIYYHDLPDRGTSLIISQSDQLPDGKFHDQGDAKWIVIRGKLRGHNNTPCGRPAPSRPIGRQGLAARRAYLVVSVTIN
jgi:hypothetical protein